MAESLPITDIYSVFGDDLSDSHDCQVEFR